jgi:nicotinamidase-related amidase
MTNQTVFRPRQKSTGLLVIDIQEKFKPAIARFDTVVVKAVTLIRAFGILHMPVFSTEQYPQGLGPTVKPVADILPVDAAPLTKKTFSCCGAQGFMEQFERSGISAIALCGIETHVCVYQTALDLIDKGFTLIAVADAMASRNDLDHATAIERIRQAGGIILTVEMFLFDLLKTAESPDFREIQKLVK